QACSNNVFCAYHSVYPEKAPEEKEIIYSDIPTSLLDEVHAKDCQSDGLGKKVQEPNGDSKGYADVALKYISHEYIEASTDPQLSAWFDTEGREIGDKCNSYGAPAGNEVDPNAFLPVLGGEAGKGTLFNQSINADRYYVQSEWDNGASACSMKPVPLEGVGFTPSSSFSAAPNPATAGTPVGFDGSASSDPDGTIVTYSWQYGDGGTGGGVAPSHAYAGAGTYMVSLTATDSAGVSATTSHAVTVNAAGVASIVPNSEFNFL